MLSTNQQSLGHYAIARFALSRGVFFLAIAAITGCDPQTPSSAPAGFTAKVVGITDGDTIDVLLDDKTTQRLRLNGIDAPERGQPFGNNAKQFLSDRIGGQLIQITPLDTDRYGRTIAELNHNHERITLALVRQGLAWHYVRYSDDPDLDAAQREAQANARGLWSDPRHVPPWEWRKLSKEERDQLR